MSVTQDRLKQVLHYDPATGIFTWLRTMGRQTAGEVAGTVREDGYIRLQIDGERRYASHWACLYMTGVLPPDEMDHEDRNRANNAWLNLRHATKSQNCANRPQTSKSGDLPRGVTRRGKKFVSQMRSKGVTHYLGIYDTPDEAHAAYAARAIAEFGEFSVLSANDNGKMEVAA